MREEVVLGERGGGGGEGIVHSGGPGPEADRGHVDGLVPWATFTGKWDG